MCYRAKGRVANIVLGVVQHHRLVGKEQGSVERHCRRPIQEGIQQTVGGDLRRPSGSIGTGRR